MHARLYHEPKIILIFVYLIILRQGLICSPSRLGAHCVASAGLGLAVIPLPLPPEFEVSHALAHPAFHTYLLPVPQPAHCRDPFTAPTKLHSFDVPASTQLKKSGQENPVTGEVCTCRVSPTVRQTNSDSLARI